VKAGSEAENFCGLCESAHFATETSDYKFFAAGAEFLMLLRQAADERHFFVTGFVDDVSEYHNSSRAFVAPIKHVTGTQNKILEATSCGLAVVATPEATDAIATGENPPLLAARGTIEFAEKS